MIIDIWFNLKFPGNAVPHELHYYLANAIHVPAVGDIIDDSVLCSISGDAYKVKNKTYSLDTNSIILYLGEIEVKNKAKYDAVIDLAARNHWKSKTY